MPLAQLISPPQLAARQQTAGLVILDCRFALEDPDYGLCSYAEGHIEGAQYADLERHLSGPETKGVTGRHPLPVADTFAKQLRAWGISADTDVVLYDDGPGAYAARAWWLLAWLGKREGVFILDGGLKAWHAAGFPLSLDAPVVEPGTFAGKPDNGLLLDAVARRNLELDSSTSGERRHSLLGVLDRTAIVLGVCELRRWLHRPLRDRVTLLQRQEAIAALPYAQSRVLGSLILVDTASHKTSGALMLN